MVRAVPSGSRAPPTRRCRSAGRPTTCSAPCSTRSVAGILTTSPRTPTWASVSTARAGAPACSTRAPSKRRNSDFVNWMKQRSRWYKGYLTTWLVHLRHPVQLRREIGTRGFLQFMLFVGGTPILALLNPVFWTLTVLWFVGHPRIVQDLYPTPVYFMGLACFCIGNFAVYYLTVLVGPALRSAVPRVDRAAHTLVLGDDVDRCREGRAPARRRAVVLGEDDPRARRRRRGRARAGWSAVRSGRSPERVSSRSS